MSACRSVTTAGPESERAPPAPAPAEPLRPRQPLALAPAHPGLREARPSFRFELAQDRLHGGVVRLRNPHRPGTSRLVGDRGGQEPERGGGPRRGRHHHLAHSELAGDPRRVERPRPAHRDHRVAPRITALLHDVHARGARHVLAHEVVDPPGRVGDGQIELRGEPRHRRLGGRGIEGHPPAEEVAGIEVAEQQVRIRYRGLVAALSVAGRAGLGSGALRPDLEQPQLVHPGDGAASRPDFHHVDDRRMHREAAPALEPAHARRLEHRRDVRLAVLDEGRLGGRAPHVEGEEVGVADGPADEGARLRPARRPRFQEADGETHRGLRGGETAGGLDEVETPAESAFAKHPLEAPDVRGHEGLHVGVRGGGRGPLVLVDLRVHVARDGHRQIRELGPHEVAHRALVRRVLVGVEEADRERLHPVLDQLANFAADRVGVDRLEHDPVAAHPLGDLAPVAASGERLREGQEEVVDVVALLRPHLEDVAKAAGGEEAGGPRCAR